MLIAVTGKVAGQKQKNIMMNRYTQPTKLIMIPKIYFTRQGPHLSYLSTCIVSAWTVSGELVSSIISPRIRRQRSKTRAMKYEENSPSKASEKTSSKTVVDPILMDPSSIALIVTRRIVAIGSDNRV
jgi:hypothetical protein